MKIYTCPLCHATYLHDQAYRHAVYECPKRAERLTLTKGGTHGEMGHRALTS